MSQFPTDFDNITHPLTADILGEIGQEALRQLADKGCEVHYGLTLPFAAAVIETSREPSIQEYCPKDSGMRFKDLTSTKEWLAKGRAMFLLLRRNAAGEMNLAGYGWSGHSSSLRVPSGETTFALRLGEVGQGQGLAAPFAHLIVLGTAIIYGATNIWLETWQSNEAAVHIYHKIGFDDVEHCADKRITGDGIEVPDSRIFMSFPNKLLPSTDSL